MNKKQRRIEAKKREHKKNSVRNRYSPVKRLNYVLACMYEGGSKGREGYTKWQKNTIKKVMRRRYPEMLK